MFNGGEMSRERRELIKLQHKLFQIRKEDRDWEETSYRFDERNEMQNSLREEAENGELKGSNTVS